MLSKFGIAKIGLEKVITFGDLDIVKIGLEKVITFGDLDIVKFGLEKVITFGGQNRKYKYKNKKDSTGQIHL